MAISVSIYSNANSSSKSISFDFVGDVLAASDSNVASWTANNDYYFKITTSARQDNNRVMPAKVVRDLTDLVLGGQKQSAENTSNAYSDIRSMIVDYTYDIINGHTQNQYSTTGVALQRPMKF